MALSPDLPSRDPAEDLYGHAPFAEQLARSIMRQQGEAGLVLALHGPWGSGKTTVLGYVHHFLKKADADHEIVIVDFNPGGSLAVTILPRHSFASSRQSSQPGARS